MLKMLKYILILLVLKMYQKPIHMFCLFLIENKYCTLVNTCSLKINIMSLPDKDIQILTILHVLPHHFPFSESFGCHCAQDGNKIYKRDIICLHFAFGHR